MNQCPPIIVASCLCTLLTLTAAAEDPQLPEEKTMQQARGSFEVELTPRKGDGDPDDPNLGRMSISKSFTGDLEGTSIGQMLSARTATQGSAGYVAIELVEGTLHGRKGTFVLQHSGTMDRGNPSLSVTVVPDSGTAELEGLSGSMAIIIEGGEHSYVLDYTLPED